MNPPCRTDALFVQQSGFPKPRPAVATLPATGPEAPPRKMKNRRDTIRHGGYFSISFGRTNDVRTPPRIVLSDSVVTKKRTWRAVSSYLHDKDSFFFTENRELQTINL